MKRHILTILIGLMLLLSGCAPQPVFTPTPTKTPNPNFGLLNNRTTTPSVTPAVEQVQVSATPAIDVPEPSATSLDDTTEEPTPIPNETTDGGITGTPTDTPPPPPPAEGLPADHYVLSRPIPNGWRDFLDRTYPYGGTSGGRLRPHTGVEFPNPITTPVIAVGNAVVEYAGTDTEILYGPQPDFYGNLIVLRLTDYTAGGQPLYVLYGHLSEIFVESGQPVPINETIGAVGATGVAAGGAHLHFEVRVGDPQDYFTSTRNPDLWIKPYWGYGTLAGHVVDPGGNYFREVGLIIKGEDAVRYTWTYSGDENQPDSAWGENFTYGDLPEGWYTVTTRSSRRSYFFEVYIQPNQTTWLEIVFD